MGLLWAFGGTLIFAILAGVFTKDHQIGLAIGFVLFVTSGLGAWIFGDTAIAIIVWILGIFLDAKLFEEGAEGRQRCKEARAQEMCKPLREEIIRVLSKERKSLEQRCSELLVTVKTQNITLQFVDLVAACVHDDHLLVDAPSMVTRRQRYNDYVEDLKKNNRKIAEIDSTIETIEKCDDLPSLRKYAVSILGEQFASGEAARRKQEHRKKIATVVLVALIFTAFTVGLFSYNNWKVKNATADICGKTFYGSSRRHVYDEVMYAVRFDTIDMCTIEYSEYDFSEKNKTEYRFDDVAYSFNAYPWGSVLRLNSDVYELPFTQFIIDFDANSGAIESLKTPDHDYTEESGMALFDSFYKIQG